MTDVVASSVPPVLEASHLGKTFGGGLIRRRPQTRALEDFSISFMADEPRIVALAGQSGSGKTTAAQLLLGLAVPTDGTVRYNGRDVHSLRGDARRQFRRDVQAVLQDPYSSFNPVYRVRARCSTWQRAILASVVPANTGVSWCWKPWTM